MFVKFQLNMMWIEKYAYFFIFNKTLTQKDKSISNIHNVEIYIMPNVGPWDVHTVTADDNVLWKHLHLP